MDDENPKTMNGCGELKHAKSIHILKDHGQCKDKTVLGPADHTHVMFRDSIYSFSIHTLCMFIKYTFQTREKRTHLDHRFDLYIRYT